MKLQIKPGRDVGDNCKPYLIAECGSNWSTFEQAKDSIAQAKLAGADCVKFQLYSQTALYGFPVWSGKLLTDTGPHVEIPLTGQLPLEWLPRLKEKADAVGIDFLCSAFSPELIEAVDPYVTAHKVASAELTHVRMLEKLKKIGKPVILSTGASGDVDIKNALSVLGDTPVVLMYCVAAYPASGVDLFNIRRAELMFGRLAGYSDHTTDVETIPPLAQSHGACVIEKHFTAFPELNTPDRPHSLTVDQFKRMVFAIRNHKYKPIITPAIDHEWKGPTSEEQPMVSRHNRRLIATQDLLAGHVLREGENFGIYRSLVDDSHAFSPWAINDINGKTLKQPVKAGAGIGPGDVII